MADKNYGANEIVSLSAGEGFRLKLGMYLSADLEEALVLGLRELIYNSQDEYEQGFGNTIKITIDTKNNIMSCEDNARGIPVGIRKDGINSLIAAFTIPHSGAKHDIGVYAGAVGVNGEGCKILCHTSKWMDVTVWRDNKTYKVHFESDDKGAKTDGVHESAGSSKTGTYVIYQPDPKVYKDAKMNIDKVRQTLRELSYFTKGLKFILKVDSKPEEVFLSKNGLADALEEKSRIHSHILSYTSEIDEVKVELALQWSKEPQLKPFANNLYMPDGGAFMTGFKTALTKAFNNGCDKNFSGDILRKYLDGFVSVKVKTPSYSNQAKTSLANPEARGAVSQATTEAIKSFMTKYPKDIEQIIKVVEAEQKAEVAAQRARDSINKVMSGEKNLKFKDKAAKLCDCSEPNGELYLVEGDSAGGSAKNARDAKFQAILPLRGKILNTTEKDVGDILQNEEIKGIINTLGCGIGFKFNIDNLRYDKIILMSDADPDGKHINLLETALFMVHLPGLIEAGKVYAAVSPFYIIKEGDKRIYLYNDKELDVYIRKNGKPKFINRIKGLGELSPEELWDTTMNPANRKLVQLTTDNFDKSLELLKKLMGKMPSERKEFINNYQPDVESEEDSNE